MESRLAELKVMRVEALARIADVIATATKRMRLQASVTPKSLAELRSM